MGSAAGATRPPAGTDRHLRRVAVGPAVAIDPALELAKAVHDLRGVAGSYALYADVAADQAAALDQHELARTLSALSADAIRLEELMTAIMRAGASPDRRRRVDDVA